MKSIQTLFLGSALASFCLLASCGGSEEPSTAKTYNFERADSLPSDYLQELGIVKTNIEVTAKLFQQMNQKGYSFNDSYMLSAGKSFSGSNGQAMGLGAMGSDLVYTAAFGQNQSAMDRMKSLVGIAGSLGISEAFDEKLMEQLASDDSTVNKSVILTKAYLNAKDQLFSDERAQLATFMVVGGWLEGLHIGTQLIKENVKDKETRIGYWEICNGYGNVMHMMKVFEGEAEMKSAMEDLKTIEEALKRISKNSKKYSLADVEGLETAVNAVRGKLL